MAESHCDADARLQQSQRLPLVLAIESSTRAASLALLRGTETIDCIALNPDARTTAAFGPALQSLLAILTANSEQPDLIAVTDGPGSFTGLRVGVTAAKSLAYALRCSVAAIDSLANMAYQGWQVCPDALAVTVVLNAYRGQWFVATWTKEQWSAAMETADFASQSGVVMADEFQAHLKTLPAAHVLITEPALIKPLPQALQRVPLATITGLLALQAARNHRLTSPLTLLPRYLRESAAEEKLLRST